eukprot:gene6729-17285_t
MLHYVASSDSAADGDLLPADELRYLRYNSNPGYTGDRMGVLPIYEGMRVELADKVSSEANLLKAKSAVVEQIIFDAREDLSWDTPSSVERHRGWVVLKYMPRVWLKVPGYTGGSIDKHPDILQITASKAKFSWAWKSRRGYKRDAMRVQLPILPTDGCTPYTAQGMTALWALLHLYRHSQMSWYDWWYQIYVALSRVQHHSRVAVYGPPPPELKRVMELGPQPHIIAEVARLRQRAEITRRKVHAAQWLMRWPRSGKELAEWRQRNGVQEDKRWAPAYEARFAPLHADAASVLVPPKRQRTDP